MSKRKKESDREKEIHFASSIVLLLDNYAKDTSLDVACDQLIHLVCFAMFAETIDEKETIRWLIDRLKCGMKCAKSALENQKVDNIFDKEK